jgi:hypothetical protein
MQEDAAVKPSSFWSSDVAILCYLALATVGIHLLTGNQYGFHRDELATLDDARRLAWGYVAYPPIAPLFGRISLELFGTSLAGFRFFASVVDGLAVILTGVMAREMGGGRPAQLIAAFAALPFCLGAGTIMQYVSFDYFFWVLTAYFVVRLARTEDPRWWLAIGSSIGLGMEAKYTMGFFASGIAVGVLLTGNRRYLKSWWLWLGVALAILIFLPNLIWQAQHHFVSLQFLSRIHARDIRIGRTDEFLPDQLKFTLLAFPLWLAGVYACFAKPEARRYRIIGWMYLVPFVLFVIAKGRGYYLGPAYPMLYAAGSVFLERWTAGCQCNWWRVDWGACLRWLVWTALLLDVVVACAITLPVAPINSSWWKIASKIQGDFREELGWVELVQSVAQIRDRLPSEDRSHLGILAQNYGEAGAVNLYGPRFGLPSVISGANSFWEHGYSNPPPETLIVVGFSREFLEHNFAFCQVAGHTSNRFGVLNEESKNHPDIFLCRGLKMPWPEFWKSVRSFG